MTLTGLPFAPPDLKLNSEPSRGFYPSSFTPALALFVITIKKCEIRIHQKYVHEPNYCLVLKKCPQKFILNMYPRKFIQKMSTKIYPKRGLLVDNVHNNSPKASTRIQGEEFLWKKSVLENSPKVSMRIHPLKMSTRILPF